MVKADSIAVKMTQIYMIEKKKCLICSGFFFFFFYLKKNKTTRHRLQNQSQHKVPKVFLRFSRTRVYRFVYVCKQFYQIYLSLNFQSGLKGILLKDFAKKKTFFFFIIIFGLFG
jgi:hypothetical protein